MARRKTRPKKPNRPANTRPLEGPAVAEPVSPPVFSGSAHPEQTLEPAAIAAAGGRLWPHAAAVLLLPLLVLWHKDNALYTPGFYADPWFYLGYFRNLLEFKRDLFYGFYYGSRLPWILPGSVVHSLFPPLAANAMLHLAVHSTATLSLFSILVMTTGRRIAFLATMVFAVNPWLWAATGWDYVDGPGIAYCLLAMALLTRAAAGPNRRWTLAAAGIAIALLVYTHLLWVTFVPLLAVWYAGLSWAWRRVPPLRPVLDLVRWGGAGFALVTVVFCGVNYLLDGRFWFYAPSVARAQLLSKNFMFVRSIRWQNGELVPWLWPAVAGVLTALAVLPAYLRKGAVRPNAAGLLAAAQLLAACAYMGYLQAHGTTVLGHYPYTSYLLPFIFLVMGMAFWPAAQTMGVRQYVLLSAAAAAAFAVVWHDPGDQSIQPSQALVRWALVAAVGTLAAALFWRKRELAPWLAMAGFVAFTHIAVGHTVYMGGVNLHGSREQYRRIMHAHQRIDAARNGSPVRFWFDKTEPLYHEYHGLNAIYLAEFSRLSDTFPHGCETAVDPGTLMVVTSQKDHAAELARTSLENCWKPFGMLAVPAGDEQLRTERGPYTLALLRAEAIREQWPPLTAMFDASGTGYVRPVEDGIEHPPSAR